MDRVLEGAVVEDFSLRVRVSGERVVLVAVQHCRARSVSSVGRSRLPASSRIECVSNPPRQLAVQNRAARQVMLQFLSRHW